MRARRFFWGLALCVAAVSGCSSAGGGADAGVGTEDVGAETGDGDYAFEPIACMDLAPDVLTQRLCSGTDDPDALDDKVFVDCAVESDCLGPDDPAPADELVVMTWNILRGEQLDAQIAAFADGTKLPMPDILLLSEVDRGCTRSGGRNVARVYAEALGMHYVYGVEFVELPRGDGQIDGACEHGNAVLSRYPIGNVELVRHETNKSWYETSQPRLGGRMALVADVQVGDHVVHVASVHFESGVTDEDIRGAQAAEIAALLDQRPHAKIVAGDMNAGTYFIDVDNGSNANKVGRALKAAGFEDAHITLDPSERATHGDFFVIDLIFGKDTTFKDPGLCPLDVCTGLSDHAPVWTTIEL